MTLNSIPESTGIAATETALATTLDGEAVLLETESGTYYGLNEVATFIWDQLQEPRTIADLHEAVVSEYDVTPERAMDDLETVLVEMNECGLVTFDEDT